MRLTEWRAAAPHRDALGTKVLTVLEPVLRALGAEDDPHVWVDWGEDPSYRYTLLVPTAAGLGVCAVRPGGGPDGPRIGAKLVRWGRVQLGELTIETQAGHRLATVQLEGQVLRGVDDDGDRVARFVRAVAAGIDGRPVPSLDEPKASARRTTVTTAPGGRPRTRRAGS
ncbi:MAG TPA: hypothetical protein VFR93_00425 [Candidatus Limnocylindrales bacterium]|nr:hypothetical protein [Candidatus Limnocylindrales bacterium]